MRRCGDHRLDRPLDIRPTDCRGPPRHLFGGGEEKSARPNYICACFDVGYNGARRISAQISFAECGTHAPTTWGISPFLRILRTPGPAYQVGRRERDATASWPSPLQYLYPAFRPTRPPPRRMFGLREPPLNAVSGLCDRQIGFFACRLDGIVRLVGFDVWPAPPP